MAISWEDFEKIDMRVGTVTAVEDFPQARKPAYKLTIDFGSELGTKQSSAQITVHYHKEDILGRQVIAVVNFPAKLIAGFKSECLVLGLYDQNRDVILLAPERYTDNGMKVG